MHLLGLFWRGGATSTYGPHWLVGDHHVAPVCDVSWGKEGEGGGGRGERRGERGGRGGREKKQISYNIAHCMYVTQTVVCKKNCTLI